MSNKESIKSEDLLNFSNISLLLTGRNDVIRKNRVQKKYNKKLSELLEFIEYWKTKV